MKELIKSAPKEELIQKAKDDNHNIIEKYRSDLTNISKLHSHTISSYISLINTVIDRIPHAISEMNGPYVSAVINLLYDERSWAVSYTNSAVGVLDDFFMWCYKNNYMNTKINIINPFTGKVLKNHSMAVRDRASTSVNNSKPQKSLFDKCSNVDGTSKKLVARNKAISLLKSTTNINNRELCDLDINDFRHSYITIYSEKNHKYNRQISVSANVRVAIYEYLCLRNDSCKALFLSEIRENHRITRSESRSIL